jgi:hypothetical protein
MIVASRLWGSDGRLACKALYGIQRPGSELDAGSAGCHPSLDCRFVVVTPDKGRLSWRPLSLP